MSQNCYQWQCASTWTTLSHTGTHFNDGPGTMSAGTRRCFDRIFCSSITVFNSIASLEFTGVICDDVHYLRLDCCLWPVTVTLGKQVAFLLFTCNELPDYDSSTTQQIKIHSFSLWSSIQHSIYYSNYYQWYWFSAECYDCQHEIRLGRSGSCSWNSVEFTWMPICNITEVTF